MTHKHDETDQEPWLLQLHQAEEVSSLHFFFLPLFIY